MSRHKFTNVYRAAGRTSQYLISEVIYRGPQDAEEIVFRILLFKSFNRIETWREFRATAAPIDYRCPPKWGLPPERTAPIRDA